MAVLQELGGRLSNADLHSYLFLYCREYVENNHYYEFIPQEFGAFSLQADADKALLINKKLIAKADDWQALPTKERFAVGLDFFEKIAIQKLKNDWVGKTGAELQVHLTAHHPQYFLDNLAAEKNDEIIFYTIGYEGISPDIYVSKLLTNNIKLLCDVRKNAFSQKAGFSKAELQASLAKVGIEYRHIPDLGIVSEKRQSLNSYQDYKELFDEYERETLSKQGANLLRLQQLLEQKQRIAITCFEADYHCCHRSRVAKALAANPNFNYKIEHL